MLKKFSKRAIITTLSVALCFVIAGVTTAVSIGRSSGIRMAIDASEVLQEHYTGVGANMWVNDLDEESIAYLDMSEAYVEVNLKRLMTVKPKLMRIMIMPQYIIDASDGKNGEENWKNGIYDFDTDSMHNFWRYCELFKASGTQVELNFGGATSTDVLEWFGIPDLVDQHGGTRSAPEDLEAWALATASLLKECHDRGYGDVVTYLNFYNESGHANYGAYGDKRVYWCKMLELVHYELLKDDYKVSGKTLRELTTVIGADNDTQQLFGYDTQHKEWFDYIYENAYKKGYCDTMSTHTYMNTSTNTTYMHNVNEVSDYLQDVVAEYPDMDQDLMVTEFGRLGIDGVNGEGTDGGYSTTSAAGQLIVQANAGVSASLYWFGVGGYIPSPLSNFQAGATLWDSPSLRNRSVGVTDSYTKVYNGVDGVTATFGELGMVMRYIENDSKIIKTTTNSDDFRLAAYTKDEDTTIVVEIERDSESRDFTIDLDDRTDKTYYRHIYEFPSDDVMISAEADSQFGENAILPEGTALDTSSGEITDSVGEGHYLIVYTTYPNAQQVVLEDCEIEIKAGESAEIKVTEVIGFENSDITKVEYSVLSGTDEINGTLSGNTYTASADAQVGDTVAIMVKSTADDAVKTNNSRYDTDSYAVAVIRIVE